MRKVSVITHEYEPNRHILRQSPNESGIWGNYKFEPIDINNVPLDDNDIAIVLQPYISGYIRKAKNLDQKLKILILTEPEHTSSRLEPDFLCMYDYLITPYRTDISWFNKKIFDFVPVPWTIGTMCSPPPRPLTPYSKGYDELKKIQFNKNKNISIISSKKEHSGFHFKRIEVVEELKSSFKELDLFGFGFNQIPDKWDALAPYKYTIVIENGSIDYWWCEKIADAFLSGCFVFYWGCPNLDRWFHPETFAYINIFDKNETLNIIKTVIKNNIYEKVKDKIEINRRLILDKYQFFPYMANFLDGVLK